VAIIASDPLSCDHPLSRLDHGQDGAGLLGVGVPAEFPVRSILVMIGQDPSPFRPEACPSSSSTSLLRVRS
jgi:hypothetical protein